MQGIMEALKQGPKPEQWNRYGRVYFLRRAQNANANAPDASTYSRSIAANKQLPHNTPIGIDKDYAMDDNAHEVLGGEGRSLDRDMKHICNEVGITPGMRVKMIEYGICTVVDLMQIRGRLENELAEWRSESASKRRNWIGIREDTMEKLLLVIKWRERNQSANIIEVFDEKIVVDDNFCDDYISMNIMGSPNDDANVEMSKDVQEDDELASAVIRKYTDKIMESPNLREACGKFDYCFFLDKCIRHFIKESCGLKKKAIFVLAAPTQSGKSSVKGVVQNMCGMMRVPLLILTKGVGESIDLHFKLIGLSAGTMMKEEHIVVGELLQ